jgi:hypothetical protein
VGMQGEATAVTHGRGVAEMEEVTSGLADARCRSTLSGWCHCANMKRGRFRYLPTPVRK